MNEREIQSLLALAAKRLHTTPEALRAAAENAMSAGDFSKSLKSTSDRGVLFLMREV